MSYYLHKENDDTKNSQTANSDVKLQLLERLDAIGYNKIVHQGRNIVKIYKILFDILQFIYSLSFNLKFHNPF